MADLGEVDRLLEQQRSAHAAYRRAANPAPPARPNYPEAESHISKALTFLEQAHALDPEHRSAGWAQTEAKASYAKLADWYRKYPLIA